MWTGQDRNIYIIRDNGKPLTHRAKLLIEHLKTYTANIPSIQGVVPDFDDSNLVPYPDFAGKRTQ